MGRKFGISFSWKRAIGISSAKGKTSRKTGIPLTQQGRQRKIGRAVGCCIPIAIIIVILGIVSAVVLCSCSPPTSPPPIIPSNIQTTPNSNIPSNATTNSNSNNAPSKTTTNASPCTGATAICRDGSCSYSAHRQGTCSYHGGVAKWLKN
jgi:hypothetical protein